MSTETPNCGTNRDFRPIYGFGIDDWLTVVNKFRPSSMFITLSVGLRL